jgi:hypothetical protein
MQISRTRERFSEKFAFHSVKIAIALFYAKGQAAKGEKGYPKIRLRNVIQGSGTTTRALARTIYFFNYSN